MTAAAPIPRTLEELLTPEWLTAALATRFPGIEVTAVIPGPVVSRVTTNARFRIECAGGVPDGLAADLCAKGYFSETGRPLSFLAAREVAVYRDLVSQAKIRTLHSVYADSDPDTGAGVVITEDVIAAGGRFLDALTSYTPAQAAESLEQLARLHAFTWDDPRYGHAPWLQSMLPTYLNVRGRTEIEGNFDGPLGAAVPDDVKDPDRLIGAIRALADRTPGATQIIHGDAHVGNLFLDAHGCPALVDWQCAQVGQWGLDVGYHIASALTTDDRQRHERELLTHYLEALRAGGVDPPGWNAAWDQYRSGVTYGFFMWSITLHVDPAIIGALLQRLGAAAAEHDCLAVAE